jgi:hypothetical protein
MTQDETPALPKSKSVSGESADSNEDKSLASSDTTQVVVYVVPFSLPEPARNAFRFVVWGMLWQRLPDAASQNAI